MAVLLCKGQLISKEYFQMFCFQIFQKTRLKFFYFFALAYWGRNFSFAFWENWKKPKFSFQINWPLEGKQASMQIHQSGTLRRTCSMACKLLLFFFPLTQACYATDFLSSVFFLSPIYCVKEKEKGLSNVVVQPPSPDR